MKFMYLNVVASFQCYVRSSKEEGLKTAGLNGHSNLIQAWIIWVLLLLLLKKRIIHRKFNVVIFIIFIGLLNVMMEETIGELEVELDGRFSSMRTRETNLGKLC